MLRQFFWCLFYAGQKHLLVFKVFFLLRFYISLACGYVTWRFNLSEIHWWASTSILMSAVSDIDISLFRYRKKYVVLKTVIPILEELWYRRQSPFECADKKKKHFIINLLWSNHSRVHYQLATVLIYELWNVRCVYRIKDYSIADLMSDSALFSPI